MHYDSFLDFASVHPFSSALANCLCQSGHCLGWLFHFFFKLDYCIVEQESPFLQPLRVMVIEEMIYLVHRGGISELLLSSINLQTKLLFVDLEQDPPKVFFFLTSCIELIILVF